MTDLGATMTELEANDLTFDRTVDIFDMAGSRLTR